MEQYNNVFAETFKLTTVVVCGKRTADMFSYLCIKCIKTCMFSFAPCM